MELTLEQAAVLSFMRELGEKEGPDSAAQKEYDEMVALLTHALAREFLVTGEITLEVVKEEE
jgi:hypothetical protein